MGFEPMNTGFADQRVSHFATGALVRHTPKLHGGLRNERSPLSPRFLPPTAVAPSYADTALPSYIQGKSSLRPHWIPRL
jgi:hypothetical protein